MKGERLGLSLIYLTSSCGAVKGGSQQALHCGGLVIAPCEADETSAAYLAKTPVG
jgi:hypothetical protein